MNDETIFGPGHDREPGVKLVPGALPPQIIEWQTESCGVHSRSRGWLPGVIVRIATADGAGLVGSIECDESLDEIIAGLIIARDRARLDIKASGLTS